MKLPIAIIAAVAGAAIVAGSSSAKAGTLPSRLEGLDGAEEIVDISNRAGLPDDWIAFLLAKSYVETGGKFDPLLGRGRANGAPLNAKINKSQGEQAAAERAWDRLVDQGRLNPDLWPRESWIFGSGGLFALIPASVLVGTYEKSGMKDDPEIMDPWSVFDPAIAVFLAIDYNDRLMGWSGYQSEKTWGNLYKGWKQPSNMGKDNETTRRSVKAFREALAATGSNPNLADRKPTPIPDPMTAIRPLILGGMA